MCAREIALMRWLDWRGQIHFFDLVDEEASSTVDTAAENPSPQPLPKWLWIFDGPHA